MRLIGSGCQSLSGCRSLSGWRRLDHGVGGRCAAVLSGRGWNVGAGYQGGCRAGWSGRRASEVWRNIPRCRAGRIEDGLRKQRRRRRQQKERCTDLLLDTGELPGNRGRHSAWSVRSPCFTRGEDQRQDGRQNAHSANRSAASRENCNKFCKRAGSRPKRYMDELCTDTATAR